MKVMTAEQAVELIQDNQTVVVCGCENLLLPEKTLKALEDRFLATGHPRGLTEVHPIIYGMGVGLGLEHFAHPGMTRRVIGSGYSYLKTSRMSQMVLGGEVEAYMAPMGTVFGLLRDIASGRDFYLTSVGLNTFVDPRLEGGRVNSNTTSDLCSLLVIGGKEYLSYPTFPIDVAIIRATTADTDGNLTLEDEPVTLGIATLAMAAKNSGGKVIAQVRRLAQARSLKPRQVVVPGLLVDAIVVDPDQSISGGRELSPALTGEIRLPLQAIDPLPLDTRKVIVRRAAEELGEARIINLGVGIPVEIPRIALEAGIIDRLTFFPEHGSVGGVPASREIFGANINPDAIIDSTQVFDYFQGGGLSATFLGFGQIDELGNVNVSKFNGIVPGCGGFIDITHRTPKVVFCGTLTAGGLEAQVKDGQVVITKEGKFHKLVPRVEQVTFSAKNAIARGQDVTYVTERAVFKLTPRGPVLTEIAPGIRLEEDVLANIDFPVQVSPELKTMDQTLLRDK